MQTRDVDIKVTGAFTLGRDADGGRCFGFQGIENDYEITPVQLYSLDLHGIFGAIHELIRVSNRIRWNRS